MSYIGLVEKKMETRIWEYTTILYRILFIAVGFVGTMGIDYIGLLWGQ